MRFKTSSDYSREAGAAAVAYSPTPDQISAASCWLAPEL